MDLIDELLVVRRRVEVVRENEKKPFKSVILDVNQSEFAIQAPTLAGDILLLHPGEIVEVSVLAENEQYRFVTVVTGKRMDRVPRYVMKLPTEVQRVQLRNFVRIKCALEVCYQKIVAEDLFRLNLLEPADRGVTVDLSGGGMQMLVKEPMEMETLVLVKLTIPHQGKETEVPLVGKVTRCGAVQVGSLQRYVTGIFFEQISERDQDKIVSYIFRKMVEHWRATEK